MTQQSKLSIGDIVQIIDHDEIPSEWATFVITDIQSFRYCLSAKNKSPYEPLWVESNEITPIKSSKVS